MSILMVALVWCLKETERRTTILGAPLKKDTPICVETASFAAQRPGATRKGYIFMGCNDGDMISRMDVAGGGEKPPSF